MRFIRVTEIYCSKKTCYKAKDDPQLLDARTKCRFCIRGKKPKCLLYRQSLVKDHNGEPLRYRECLEEFIKGK